MIVLGSDNAGFPSPYSFRVTLNLLLWRIRSISFPAKAPSASGCSSNFSTSGILASLSRRLEAVAGCNWTVITRPRSQEPVVLYDDSRMIMKELFQLAHISE